MVFVTQFTKPEHFSVYGFSDYLCHNDHPMQAAGPEGVLENFVATGPSSYSRDPSKISLVALTTTPPTSQQITDFVTFLGESTRHTLLVNARSKVDKRTRQLFALGFRYSDGIVHSLSQNAQRTFMGMFVAKDTMVSLGMFTEDFPVSSLDDNDVTVLRGPDDVTAFWTSIVQAVADYKHGGTLIKQALLHMTDEELLSFEDPRPLEPFDVSG